jgi:2-polyprenyl-3-methyl-5-hydroxy-6-metoxy-1,4-benzoquinol methylase
MPADDLKARLTASWDAGAPGYDATPRHGLRHDDEWVAWRRLLAAILGDPAHAEVPRLRVLDVGTGTGVIALLVAELGHAVTGIDLSEGMLAEARRKAAAAGLAVDLRLGDAEDPPEALDGFDAVISRHLLWTLPDPGRALRAWIAAARPGALLAIIDGLYRPARPPLSWAVRAAGAIVARRAARDGTHHDYPPEAYARLPLARQRDTRAVRVALETAGLRDVRIRRLAEVERIERAHLDTVARLADRWTPYLATARVPAGGVPPEA